MRSLLNFALFQLVWFACVLGAARGNGWLGPLAAAAFLALELRLAPSPRRALRLFAGVALVGCAVDSVLGSLGWLGYSAPNPLAPAHLVPAWIAALWLSFAALLLVSLRWMWRRPLLAALLGAVGGPLSFLGGERLGAVSVAAPRWLGLVALSIEWAVLTPLMLDWAARSASAASRTEPRRRVAGA